MLHFVLTRKPGARTINAKTTLRLPLYGVFFAVLLVALTMTACRRAGSTGPTPIPSATATPRSTPLPALATDVPIGVETNPIRMVLRPQGAEAGARSAANALATALEEETGLTIDVETVDRYAEALAALCESVTNRITVAWVDGPTYMAALAQGCGMPALAVERGSGSNASTGLPAQIIASSTLNVEDIAGLTNRDFCRLDATDFYSWFVPSLVLRANGLDPVEDLRSVTDYEDEVELVTAVAEGRCAATGIIPTIFDDIEVLETVRDDITVVETTVPFPFDILMYPPETPLGVRVALTDALVAMSNSTTGERTLSSLLDQDSLTRVEPDDFDEFADFMNSTGLDFATLGN
ncbi:MAG: PhnD/SsuA/transferrin family substrate-binding protein [Burkholderiales bacterium]|nr:PhnD/SsuA/transferrin family substrate-binding protein [Anaerolineae bacterium]